MFAERLKEARINSKISIQELAHLVGLSRQNVYKYESGGIKNPTIENVRLIANALNVSPTWLIGWDDVNGKENTTAENSDVKCYGTSDNPMTKAEWEKFRKNSKSGPNMNQKI